MTIKKSEEIRVFAPASIANVSCAFDILGFPIDSNGDTITVVKTDEPGIFIEAVEGPGNLSTNPDENVCGGVAKAMLKESNAQHGISIKLKKGILPGSGLGSSAASSAGAAYACNKLLGNIFNEKQMVEFAMLGEAVASGTAHADNVAPALLGGFVAIPSYNPLDLVKIPVPAELFVTVIHPKIELKTELSRNVLKKQVDLKIAIKQWGNIAGLIAGLYSENYDLIGRSLNDFIIEPVRSLLIPGFNEITSAAKQSGGLGTGISGSGPSIFAFCKGKACATKTGEAMAKVANKLNVQYDIHVSPIAKQGCRII